MISQNNIADIYEGLLIRLLNNPDYVTSPRGMQINELINFSYEISNPNYFIINSQTRKTNEKYLAGELIWYLSGNNDLEHISKFSKFWNKLTDDGKLNSSYGHIIWKQKNKNGITPWMWAYQALVNDRDTRQAVIHFNSIDHASIGEKDFPCTMYAQFFIRNNSLNLIVNMRSQDIWFGYTYDIPFFSLMLIEMKNQLRDFANIDVNLGTLKMNIGSLHMYGKDISDASDIFKKPLYIDTDKGKYVYVDTNESLMLDARLFDRVGNELVPSTELQYVIDKWYKKEVKQDKEKNKDTNIKMPKIEIKSNFINWIDSVTKKGDN